LFNEVQDFTPDVSELQIENRPIEEEKFKDQTSFLQNVFDVFEEEKIRFGSGEL
jgi:hypothetical protein